MEHAVQDFEARTKFRIRLTEDHRFTPDKLDKLHGKESSRVRDTSHAKRVLNLSRVDGVDLMDGSKTERTRGQASQGHHRRANTAPGAISTRNMRSSSSYEVGDVQMSYKGFKTQEERNTLAYLGVTKSRIKRPIKKEPYAMIDICKPIQLQSRLELSSNEFTRNVQFGQTL
ncbi:predicted protein [Nematostella vectensis]|uniref:Uncharacterized protein n=1 Tax=Nematostella vectensis TaxID=45351 RepID=A7RU45_NEMVE|nr:predicted protein [Nematostella vectensis]|eukprot:XP_001637084.1 predicted protein [Nematostella vectensis]